MSGTRLVGCRYGRAVFTFAVSAVVTWMRGLLARDVWRPGSVFRSLPSWRLDSIVKVAARAGRDGDRDV